VAGFKGKGKMTETKSAIEVNSSMTSNAEIVRQFVRKTFARQVLLRPITDDSPLFSSGIIDSFGVLELIAFLEETFQVNIDTSQRELSEFDTIAKIDHLITQLQSCRN
jgi:acyl carrier protein